MLWNVPEEDSVIVGSGIKYVHRTINCSHLGWNTEAQQALGTTTLAEKLGRDLQSLNLSLVDLCTTFFTLLQSDGALNSPCKELEVAMEILLMLTEPFGAAGWRMKQHQGSSKGNTPGTRQGKDMDFILWETEGCLQSCWADDGLQAHTEHVQLWQSTPR